jgi:hypothetical protein
MNIYIKYAELECETEELIANYNFYSKSEFGWLASA